MRLFAVMGAAALLLACGATAVGCGDDDGDSSDKTESTDKSESTDNTESTESTDKTEATDKTDSSECQAKQKAFSDFLEANRACTAAADCTVIGNCGPNADFTAVRSDAAEEASKLQAATCLESWDGPLYEAVCEQEKCGLKMLNTYCGMPTPDTTD